MSNQSSNNLADSVALDILGTKWKPRVIVQLHESGAMGFGSLKTRLDGISNKVLSNNLDDLIEHAVLHKEVLQESPRRVEFTLTPAGDELYALIEATADWDDKYVESYGLPRVLIVDDDPRQTELLSSWLNTEYDVITTTDSDAAREALDETIDVAIFDRRLEDTTAETLVENARQVGISPPTVFLSAADVSVSAINLPADLLLTKPSTRDEAVEAVNMLHGMNDFSDLRRKIQAHENRLRHVREVQGPAVETTSEYEQAEATLVELRERWQDELEDRDPWRSLSKADSVDELFGNKSIATND